MNLSGIDLEIIISKLGGRSNANRGRPGVITAEHVLDLIKRLEAERDKRAVPAVRPYNSSIGDQD